MFEFGRRRDSNMQPSNINETNVVAPTGFVRWWAKTSRFQFTAWPLATSERRSKGKRLWVVHPFLLGFEALALAA
jgi:hypothetical protein